MNIFIIPSWYPSEKVPSYGIFIKEQIELLGEVYKNEVNIGISLWGQNNSNYLLYAKDTIINLCKVLVADTTTSIRRVGSNISVYESPTFIWSRKFLNGNIEGIIKSNLKNLQIFEAEYGRVDIIHAHVGYPAGRIAREISKKICKPYLITEHMIPFPSKYDTDKGALKHSYLKNYSGSIKNIAVTPHLEETMRDCNIHNISIIPNFIDENLFKPTSSDHKKNSNFCFFFLGDLIPRKGVDILLHALKTVLEQHKNVRCRIGGSGKYAAEYKALANQLGIKDSIEWLGELDRKKVCEEFNFCDAFVLPSRAESMGIVYIEALACGKPIIATKCGGPESIVTQFNGLLINKNKPEELAKAMTHMVNHIDDYDAHVIRQDFLNRFSSKAILPKLYNLYNGIIENQNS